MNVLESSGSIATPKLGGKCFPFFPSPKLLQHLSFLPFCPWFDRKVKTCKKVPCYLIFNVNIGYNMTFGRENDDKSINPPFSLAHPSFIQLEKRGCCYPSPYPIIGSKHCLLLFSDSNPPYLMVYCATKSRTYKHSLGRENRDIYLLKRGPYAEREGG